jgi:alkylhydroperoxidase family enzyme
MTANFNDEEQITVTLLIGVTNAFNRVNIGFRGRTAAIARAA